MSLIDVEFDLYCEKPNDVHPVYRFWVNDTMIVERAFRWNTYDNYLRERITLDVEPGSNNVIRIENITGLGEFTAQNLSVQCENEKAFFSFLE